MICQLRLPASLACALALLPVACTAPPAPGADLVDVVFMRNDGPERREELELHADGRCTWRTFRAPPVPRSWTVDGRYRIEGDRVVLDVEPRRNTVATCAESLRVRRHGGHVYLVPDDELAWFEEHGPMVEFCFHPADAPVSSGPAFFLPEDGAGASARPRWAGAGWQERLAALPDCAERARAARRELDARAEVLFESALYLGAGDLAPSCRGELVGLRDDRVALRVAGHTRPLRAGEFVALYDETGFLAEAFVAEVDGAHAFGQVMLFKPGAALALGNRFSARPDS